MWAMLVDSGRLPTEPQRCRFWRGIRGGIRGGTGCFWITRNTIKWPGFHVGRCPSNGQHLSSFMIIDQHLWSHLSTFIKIYQHVQDVSTRLSVSPMFSPSQQLHGTGISGLSEELELLLSRRSDLDLGGPWFRKPPYVESIEIHADR